MKILFIREKVTWPIMPGTIYYDDYPETKEWYLKERYIDNVFSLYSRIFDTRFYLSFKEANFYKMSKKDLHYIKRYLYNIRKLRLAKKINGSLILTLGAFVDFMIGRLSYLVYLINHSLERRIFVHYPMVRTFLTRFIK